MFCTYGTPCQASQDHASNPHIAQSFTGSSVKSPLRAKPLRFCTYKNREGGRGRANQLANKFFPKWNSPSSANFQRHGVDFLVSSTTEDFMKKAAVGFRVHSGWTALVAVALEKGQPIVLSRQRLQLVEIFSYKFRQPFHTGEKLPFAEAERLADRALHALQQELQQRGYQLDRAGLLLASGRELPELEKILKSHALIHTADGELFREALAHASVARGLQVTRTKERDLLELCAKTFSLAPQKLLHQVTDLGKPFGAPWAQDEKFATLAAWLALDSPMEQTAKP